MEDIMRMFFGLLWVVSVIWLIFIDRRFPWESPIDAFVFWIIGWYILLVFTGSKGLKTVLVKTVDKFEKINLSDFSISIWKNDKGQ